MNIKTNLINKDPKEHNDPCQVPGSKYDCQAEVHDDLGQVVRTGDVVEPVAAGDGVAAAVVSLQLGEDLVGCELVPPGPEEHDDAKPLVPCHLLQDKQAKMSQSSLK